MLRTSLQLTMEQFTLDEQSLIDCMQRAIVARNNLKELHDQDLVGGPASTKIIKVFMAAQYAMNQLSKKIDEASWIRCADYVNEHM